MFYLNLFYSFEIFHFLNDCCDYLVFRALWIFVIDFLQTYCGLVIYCYWISSSCLNLWTWSVFSGTAHPRVHQADKVITAALGNTVTLQCYSDKDNIYWYKQIAGQPPRVMSAFLKMSEPIFYKEFKTHRFWGKRLGSSSNLTISGIIQSDEAVYYCGAKAFYIEFGNGTHLIIKGKISKSSKSWSQWLSVHMSYIVFSLFVKIMHISKLQNRIRYLWISKTIGLKIYFNLIMYLFIYLNRSTWFNTKDLKVWSSK